MTMLLGLILSVVVGYYGVTPAVMSSQMASSKYMWEELDLSKCVKTNDETHREMLHMNGTKASVLLNGKPVFLSLATMSSRIGEVHKVIANIIEGPIIPDKIYLFISKESYLIDKGIQPEELPEPLVYLARRYPNMVSIVYTNNIGPHRKLLPLLSKHWTEDVLVITVDDEFLSKDRLKPCVSQLIKYFMASNGDSIIALRGRKIGVHTDQRKRKRKSSQSYLRGILKGNYGNESSSDEHEKEILDNIADGSGRNITSQGGDKVKFAMKEYKKWSVAKPGVNGMMLLPTGVGGVLYRPHLLHHVIFDEGFRMVTKTADDITFRLSAMVRRTPVIIGCTYGNEFRCPQNLNSYRSANEYIFYHKKKDKWTLKSAIKNLIKLTGVMNWIGTEVEEDKVSMEAEMKRMKSLNVDVDLVLNKELSMNVSQQESSPLPQGMSLSSSYNVQDKNVRSWLLGVKYLESKGLFNMVDFVEEFVQTKEKSAKARVVRLGRAPELRLRQ